MDKLKAALDSTTAGYERSLLRLMPRSPYRGFQLWAARSPYQDMWAQILGVPQFARLTHFLLNDLVSDADWPRLLDYSNTMNSYLILEAITDNFASYMHPREVGNPSQEVRGRLLHTLNDTMLTRLDNDATPTAELLSPANFVAKTLSCFKNSIAHEEQLALAMRFLEAYPNYALEFLEFGGWSVLVANVEACVALDRKLAGTQLHPLLHRGLRARYEAVNRLLEPGDLYLEEMVDISTYAVLVIPFLTYYISILNEIIEPSDRVDVLLKNDRLENALYQAGLLVRLSNDVGTELLMREEYRQVLIHQLQYRTNPRLTINDALLELAKELPFLTRIQKDIAFGESNTVLFDIGNLPFDAESLAHFERNLNDLALIYAQNRIQLRDQLQDIARRMGSNATSKLIWRFVEFHERLYSQPFDSYTGDYATRPNVRALNDSQ